MTIYKKVFSYETLSESQLQSLGNLDWRLARTIARPAGYDYIFINTPVEPQNLQDVSLSFNGIDEVMTTQSSLLGVANQWTLAIWAKNSSSLSANAQPARLGLSGAQLVRFEKRTGAGGERARLFVRDAVGAIKDLEYANFWTVDAWVHGVATFDGDAMNSPALVYRNGVFVNPSTVTVDDTSATMSDLTREIYVSPSNAPWAGLVHSVAVWSTPLSADEIASIHNAKANVNLNENFANYASSASLVHWFRLGYDVDNIGTDYAADPQPDALDLMTAATNITADDIVEDYPT